MRITKIFSYVVVASSVLSLSGCANKFNQQPEAPSIDGPKKALQAQYDLDTPQGKLEESFYADGKGHVRRDLSDKKNNKHISSIIDYVNHDAYTLMDDHKIALKVPISSNDLPPVVDAASAQANNAKDLGTKVIDGHNCHGWELSKAKTEVWVGDDIGWYVLSQSDIPGGKIVLHLKSFKLSAPDARAFVLPYYYQVIQPRAKATGGQPGSTAASSSEAKPATGLKRITN